MMPLHPTTSHQGAGGAAHAHNNNNNMSNTATMVPQQFGQSQSKPGSSASFASLSGGGHYVAHGSGGNTRAKKARLG
jgi:hypothetical protein